MGLPILDVSSTLMCPHGGKATALLRNPRVKIMGQNILTQTCNCSVSNCTLPPPPAANGPCAMATWVSASLRVRANGIPVLLKSSVSTCVPTGVPLQIILTQQRVTAL